MKNPTTSSRQAAAKPDPNSLEVNVAVDWWVLQLTGAMMNMHTSGPAVAKCFERSLRESLHTKYRGHWHEHQPSLGSGYRSLSYGVHMDPMLQKAGNDAGISDLEKWLQSTRHKVMFVDPRLVRIRPNCRSPNMEILYQARDDVTSSVMIQNPDPPPEMIEIEKADLLEQTSVGNPKHPLSQGPAATPSTDTVDGDELFSQPMEMGSSIPAESITVC